MAVLTGYRMERFLLTGKLLRLRPMEPSETESLWHWNSGPDVMRWISDGCPDPPAQITGRREAHAADSYDSVLLGIETLEEGRLIGHGLAGGHGPAGAAQQTGGTPPTRCRASR